MDLTPQQVAALLGRNADAVLDEVEPVVKKAAVNVKKSWADAAKASSDLHALSYPYTIKFDDVKRSGNEVSVEVAPTPDVNRQANLAPILEYGTVNNAPTGDGLAAMNSEADAFRKYVITAARKAWGRA
jgi:hypothetical protein